MPLAGKVADDWPVGTITWDGTVTCWGLLLLSETTSPPEPGGLSGAAKLSDTEKLCCMPTARAPVPMPRMAGGTPTTTVTVPDVARVAEAVRGVVVFGLEPPLMAKLGESSCPSATET